jgi:hypothetical protein
MIQVRQMVFVFCPHIPETKAVVMGKDETFKILIYHDGVEFTAPVAGRKRYLEEKTFLNNLTDVWYRPESLPRPIPDPTQDHYMLSDEQLEAYSAFRKKLDREEAQ